MENEQLGTGAIYSEIDPRTVKHEQVSMAGLPLVTGGITYNASDILHQHRVGICTAISRVQLRQKQTGKKYSPEFHYLLQKRFIDLNWVEGSSVFSAMKVAKIYGFLPIDLWTHTTETDRFLPYSQYIAKLQALPIEEILRLLKLCVDPIAGYAQVDVSNPQSIAKAINESNGGILCRYGCQMNWWTPSWLPKDIDPLRYAPETSGHAIVNSWFDYTNGSLMKLANTWGTDWDLQGSAHINWDTYPMTEAWVDLPEAPVIPPYIFTKIIKLGDRGFDVKMLQQRLNVKPDGIFGIQTKQAVIAYQKANNLVPDGIVGTQTNFMLNHIKSN